MQYVAAQQGVQPGQPVSIVLAGPSGVVGLPQQQTFMYPASQAQPYVMPAGSVIPPFVFFAMQTVI